MLLFNYSNIHMSNQTSIAHLEDLLQRNEALVGRINELLKEVDKLTVSSPPNGLTSDAIRISFELGVAAMVTRNKILDARSQAIFQVRKLSAKLAQLREQDSEPQSPE